MSLTPDHPTPPADAAPVAAATPETESAAPDVDAGTTASFEPAAAPLTGVDATATESAATDAGAEPAAVEAVTVPAASGEAPQAAAGTAQQPPATTTADPAADPAAEAGDAAKVAPTASVRPPEMSPAACSDLLKQHFPALFASGAKPLKLRIQTDIQQRAPGVFTKGALSAFFRRYTGSTGYLIALSKAEQRFDLDGQPAGELSEEHRQLAREELTRRRQLTREREQLARVAQRAQQPPATEGSAEAGPEGAPDSRPERTDRPSRPPRLRPDRPQQRGAPGPGRPPQQRPERAARPDRPERPAAGRGPGPRPEHRPAQRAAPATDRAAVDTDRATRPAESTPRPAAPTLSAESLAALQARQARHALLRDFDRTPLTLANFCALKGLKPEALAPMLELARKEAAAMPSMPAPAMTDRRGPAGLQRDDRRPGPQGDRPRPSQDARGGPRPEQRRPRGPNGQS